MIGGWGHESFWLQFGMLLLLIAVLLSPLYAIALVRYLYLTVARTKQPSVRLRRLVLGPIMIVALVGSGMGIHEYWSRGSARQAAGSVSSIIDLVPEVPFEEIHSSKSIRGCGSASSATDWQVPRDIDVRAEADHIVDVLGQAQWRSLSIFEGSDTLIVVGRTDHEHLNYKLQRSSGRALVSITYCPDASALAS